MVGVIIHMYYQVFPRRRCWLFCCAIFAFALLMTTGEYVSADQKPEMTVFIHLPVISNMSTTTNDDSNHNTPIVINSIDEEPRNASKPYWIDVNGDALLEARPYWIDVNGDSTGFIQNRNAIEQIRLDAARQISTGEGVVVAVIDTGVNLSHQMLIDNLVPGYDFIDGDDSPDEDRDNLDTDGDRLIDEAAGHGSHISGIILTAAPDAKIMPIRIFNPDGQGTYGDLIAGIHYAVDNGAQIINLSGSGEDATPELLEAIAYAYKNDVLIVSSGGYPNVGFPASLNNVLGVAATQTDGLPMFFARYSEQLPADLYAPGESILSAYYDGDYEYAHWSGNSMATPFVAGIAALVRSANPDCGVVCLKKTLQETAHVNSAYDQTYATIDALDAVMAVTGDEQVDIEVAYRPGGNDLERQIYPMLRLKNNGRSVELSDLTVRYWYSNALGGEQVAECYYADIGCGQLNLTANGDYLEVGFTNRDIFAGDSELGVIRVRVRYTDLRETYDQSDDHSYADVTEFTLSESITIYYRGELVWGNEPIVDSEDGVPFKLPSIPTTDEDEPTPNVPPED